MKKKAKAKSKTESKAKSKQKTVSRELFDKLDKFASHVVEERHELQNQVSAMMLQENNYRETIKRIELRCKRLEEMYIEAFVRGEVHHENLNRAESEIESLKSTIVKMTEVTGTSLRVVRNDVENAFEENRHDRAKLAAIRDVNELELITMKDKSVSDAVKESNIQSRYEMINTVKDFEQRLRDQCVKH